MSFNQSKRTDSNGPLVIRKMTILRTIVYFLILFSLAGCSLENGQQSKEDPHSSEEPSQQAEEKSRRSKPDLENSATNTTGGMGSGSTGTVMMFPDTKIKQYQNRIQRLQGQSTFDNKKNILRLKIRLAREYLKAGQFRDARRALRQPLSILRSSQADGVHSVLLQMYRINLLTSFYELVREQCNNKEKKDGCFLSNNPWRNPSRPLVEQTRSQLDDILNFFPKHLDLRWLLNLLELKLGNYPGSVPNEWLIPDLPDNDTPPRLTNRSGELGVDVLGRAGSVSMEDYSGDGRLDLMVSEWGYTDGQLKYFVQTEDGSFEDRTEEAGLKGIKRGLNLVHTDYNNDGHVDVLLLRGAWPQNQPGKQTNVLLKNNGDGTFENVTREVGLNSPRPTQTAVWRDFNGDGYVDLFVGNESTQNQKFESRLYQNKKGHRFVDVSDSLNLTIKTMVKGADWGDVNGDDQPDLYVSNFNRENYLFVNQGPEKGWTFRERSQSYGVSEPEPSFATGFFDYDNDGQEDIFVATFRNMQSHPTRSRALSKLTSSIEKPGPFVYRNTGNRSFKNISSKIGNRTYNFTMGANIGDINNDGYPDILLGTGAPSMTALIPNRLLINENGRGFKDRTYRYGVDHFLKGHGAAFGDVNGDGYQDIYQVIGGGFPYDKARNILLMNEEKNGNWIRIRLRGRRSNRYGIGALVKVTASTNGRKRTIFKRVSPGASFGASPLKAHVGLGEFNTIEKLTIHWPCGGCSKQTFENITINRSFLIDERKGLVRQSAGNEEP